MSNTDDLFRLGETLSEESAKLKTDQLDRLMAAAERVGKSWSGSWLGYHSRVYYENLQPVPPGARFSKEWGFMDTFSNGATGHWLEYDFDDVLDAIQEQAGNVNLDGYSDQVKKATEVFAESKANILSILASTVQNRQNDAFLSDLLDSIRKIQVFGARDFVKSLAPSGQQISRDMSAIQAGLQTPPHVSVIAQIGAIRSPFIECKKLSNQARHAASHLQKLNRKSHRRGERIGTKVFIGHGRSLVWKDLKDFIEDRLHLPWDEFNRVPIAGVTNIARLSRMLDEAAIAFLVMTAEDEKSDGKVQARMNVVHEVGLFQGRLGFEKAIVLLEDGCEEFSNILGLGQIRFPKDNIGAAFEDIRLVLEREGLLEQ